MDDLHPEVVRQLRAVGFRNVLVHQYTEVNDERVVANLDLLGDLDRFVSELAGWAREH